MNTSVQIHHRAIKASELAALVSSASPFNPVVIYVVKGSPIDDNCDHTDYLDTGMLAVVTKAQSKPDDQVSLDLDAGPFEHHNKQLEEANFYVDGVLHTAREKALKKGKELSFKEDGLFLAKDDIIHVVSNGKELSSKATAAEVKQALADNAEYSELVQKTGKADPLILIARLVIKDAKEGLSIEEQQILRALVSL